MKVLIVDDNVAVQEIIRDILSDKGHIVRLASTVDEAVEKIKSFSPDAVMLDSQVGDEDGLRVVSRVSKEYPGFDLRVILMKPVGDIAPTDVQEIKDIVDKPFKSTDILSAMDRIAQSEVQEEAEAAKKGARRTTRRLGGLFRRAPRTAAEPVQNLQESGIVFGRSYVVFEPEPDRIYGFISKFDTAEYSLLIVTSDRAKAVKERFSYTNLDVLPLTQSGRMGTEDIHALGSIMVRINGFTEGNDSPVVVFDRFGDIIEANGLNRSLLMLQQLMSGSAKACTYAVSVDEQPLTNKDRGILLHNMTEYRG